MRQIITWFKSVKDVKDTLQWIENNTNYNWWGLVAPTKHKHWLKFFKNNKKTYWISFEDNFTQWEISDYWTKVKQINFKDLINSKQKRVMMPKPSLNKVLENEINQNEEFLKMKVLQLADECESYVKEKEKLRGLLTERDIEINKLKTNSKETLEVVFEWLQLMEELMELVDKTKFRLNIWAILTWILTVALYLKW